MASMLQRIAAVAACALLLASPSSAQLIGSGHVMGNGTASPAAPTDTALSAIMGQSGSGMGSGVAGILGHAPNTNGGMATLGATPVNGQCPQFSSAGSLISIVCPTGGGGGSGTVNPGLLGQNAAYNATGAAVVGVPFQCTPIEIFGGGIGASGTTNNTAYTAAATAFGAGGGCISLSPGTYTFATSPTIIYPNGQYSVTLAGAGSDVTILKFPSSNGPLFAMGTNCQAGNAVCNPSFHVRDMTITTTQTPSSNSVCLNANFIAPQLAFPPWSDITNVTCRADINGSRTTGWGTGFNLRGVSFVDITNVQYIGMPTPTSGAVTGGSGIGLRIQGSVVQSVNAGSFVVNTAYTITSIGKTNFTAIGASSNTVGVTFTATGVGSGTGVASTLPAYAVAFNVSDSNFVTSQLGVDLGDYFQGVSIMNTNINFNTIGLDVPAGLLGGNSAILMSNSYINNYSGNVVISSPMNSVQIVNNNFLVAQNTSGVICQPCSASTFVGNVFNGPGATGSNFGLVLEGSSLAIAVTGNTFTTLNTGMLIVPPSTSINLQSNNYFGNSINVNNTGTITAGSCAGIGGTCTAGASP